MVKKRTVVSLLLMVLLSAAMVFGIRQYVNTVAVRRVPVLMLHSVTVEPEGEWSITTENLRSDIAYMQEQGYTIVSLKQVIAYADEGTPLPQKCVCLTFDDGYYDNYSNLMPLLEELQVPATVFVITQRLRPDDQPPASDGSLDWLSLDEMRQLNACQWIDVQSHTYDLHSETVDPDTGETRMYILPLEGETEEHYRSVLQKDYETADGLLKEAGIEKQFALAYPHGEGSSIAESFLKEQGVQLTLTTDYSHENIVRQYQPETVYNLGRMNLNNDTTKEELLYYLER